LSADPDFSRLYHPFPVCPDLGHVAIAFGGEVRIANYQAMSDKTVPFPRTLLRLPLTWQGASIFHQAMITIISLRSPGGFDNLFLIDVFGAGWKKLLSRARFRHILRPVLRGSADAT
jgi:hypothetical protein